MKSLLTAFISIFLLVACVTDDDPRNEGVSVGDPLPQFELTLNDGSCISTESLLGKVSVIVFFSTSCPDCQRELPSLETVYRYFEGNEGVVVFAISREENAEKVASFWKDHNLTIPYSAQTDRVVYNLFATVGVPRIYISDPANIIVESFDDSNFPSSASLIDIIESSCQSPTPEGNL